MLLYVVIDLNCSISLRNAVRYRFVDIWKVKGLPSVYFATQLTQGPVGGRYLISMMTFDKGGLWKKVQGPPRNKYDRPCTYVSIRYYRSFPMQPRSMFVVLHIAVSDASLNVGSKVSNLTCERASLTAI